jgi:hypothetical protein
VDCIDKVKVYTLKASHEELAFILDALKDWEPILGIARVKKTEMAEKLENILSTNYIC